MAFTTLSIRVEVAKKLQAIKAKGESFSDLLERLLENQPAKSVGEWLESLAPLEGRGIFPPEARKRLREDQRAPRRSPRKRRAVA
ncbi:MAG: antitoxin VapB family protein [Myxococcaceae bacterium]